MAVGVDRCLFVIFRYWYLLRFAVGGAGAGEDEVADVVVTHGLDECQAAGDVVAVVLARMIDGFSDVGVSGEVHYCGWLVLLDDFIESLSIKDIALFEWAPFDGVFVSVDEVVVGDGGVAGFCQGFAGVGAYIAGGAGDED